MQAWTTRKQVGQQSVLSLGSEKLNGQENESSVDRLYWQADTAG
jgi:hypothetical protein